jgi:hypothetical protein
VVALVIVFVLVVFGREVTHFAHQESSARTSENLSFAAVATNLLEQENSFDARLATLLTTGADLSRVSFEVDVAQLSQDLASWRAVADQMREPVLDPDLNLTLSDETRARASDYQQILAYLTNDLVLNGPPPTSLSLGEAQASLAATAATWGEERHALADQPGRVTLPTLTARTAHLDVPGYVQTLGASATLAPTRAVEIAAVQVQPAPLPASSRTIDLTPTSNMQVQVAVTNLREILQPVSMTMVFTPSAGGVQQVTQTRTLAPLSSYAFSSHTFAVHPGETGTFRVTLNAIPPSAGLVHQRLYTLSVAPASAG